VPAQELARQLGAWNTDQAIDKFQPAATAQHVAGYTRFAKEGGRVFELKVFLSRFAYSNGKVQTRAAGILTSPADQRSAQTVSFSATFVLPRKTSFSLFRHPKGARPMFHTPSRS
jgi:hypothetical protein